MKLKTLLERLSFVQWDRYVETDFNTLYIYGWIERTTDAYKDYIVIEWDLNILSPLWYITSSAIWDKKIQSVMKIKKEDHTPCKRVEDLIQIRNSIKQNREGAS